MDAVDGEGDSTFVGLSGTLEEVDEAGVPIGDPARRLVAPGAPDPRSVAAAADLLRASDFPVILAGQGVHRAGAAPNSTRH